MDLARAVLLVAVVALAIPTSSPAADPAARCKAAIVNRGTTLLSATADLTSTCHRRELRTGNIFENCPDTRGTERLDTLDAVATAAIVDACGTNSQTTACIDQASLEAFIIPLALVPVSTVPARGAKLRCLDTIGRQGVRFAGFKSRLLAQCNENVVREVAGYGPAGPSCDGPIGVQSRIAAAHARLSTKLGRACGGADGVAGTIDDLDPQTDLGFGSFCPILPYCATAIPTLPDLIVCAGCIAEEEVSQISRGLAALPLDISTGCHLAVGQGAMTFVDEHLRDMAACEDRILDGNEAFCPNQETVEDFLISESRYLSRVNTACGGLVGPSTFDLTSLANELTSTLYPLHSEENSIALKRCKVEIASSAMSTSGYARRKLRQLRICNSQVLCGQTAGICPDSEASAFILSSLTSGNEDIHERCDAYTPTTLGYGATCPAYGTCGALPTTTIDELITCLQCIADDAVDTTVALSF